MDPLMIPGAVRELVDARLVEQDPRSACRSSLPSVRLQLASDAHGLAVNKEHPGRER
jgi:hypothetical protein